MKYFRTVCLLSVLMTLCACIRIEVYDENHPDPRRQPVDANAVIVGLSMKVKTFLGSYPIEGAYFVRLEEKEDILKQDRLILAETLSNGYVYLLNAQPGRYAVVAVCYPWRFSEQVVHLLPKSLIEQSITTVAPGTVGYLGDYEVERFGRSSGGGDHDIVTYYFDLLSARLNRGVRPIQSIALPLKSVRDENSQKQFLKNTDDVLLKGRGGRWSAWIQEQLQTQH